MKYPNLVARYTQPVFGPPARGFFQLKSGDFINLAALAQTKSISVLDKRAITLYGFTGNVLAGLNDPDDIARLREELKRLAAINDPPTVDQSAERSASAWNDLIKEATYTATPLARHVGYFESGIDLIKEATYTATPQSENDRSASPLLGGDVTNNLAGSAQTENQPKAKANRITQGHAIGILQTLLGHFEAIHGYVAKDHKKLLSDWRQGIVDNFAFGDEECEDHLGYLIEFYTALIMAKTHYDKTNLFAGPTKPQFDSIPLRPAQAQMPPAIRRQPGEPVKHFDEAVKDRENSILAEKISKLDAKHASPLGGPVNPYTGLTDWSSEQIGVYYANEPAPTFGVETTLDVDDSGKIVAVAITDPEFSDVTIHGPGTVDASNLPSGVVPITPKQVDAMAAYAGRLKIGWSESLEWIDAIDTPAIMDSKGNWQFTVEDVISDLMEKQNFETSNHRASDLFSAAKWEITRLRNKVAALETSLNLSNAALDHLQNMSMKEFRKRMTEDIRPCLEDI